ncbi:YfaZ family outer membrane protein [Chitinimonas sp. PSY-7]|uniref:YfaZ family outer membrane protein n=1 Tax=Chitinimonas sp. PSY-7 TaxID=3459088 RepID=UPI0040403ACE
MRHAWLAGLVLLLSPIAQADNLDLQLSNDVFSGRYSSGLLGKSANMDFGFQHHTDNGDVATVGLLVEQISGRRDSLALGAQAVGIFNDYDNAAALALGGRFNVGLPSLPKVRIGGHLWAAPGVTTSGAKRYVDAGVRVGYQALERGEIYVGYRNTKIRYKNRTDYEMQDSAHVGLELSF